MSRRLRPAVGLVRAAAVAGCLGLMAASVNVLLMPATVVGLVAGLGGVRRAGDDLDAAGMRLGVALLVSTLVAAGSVMSGSGILGATGVATVTMFAVAWHSCQHLRRQRRLDWGVRQRQILDHQAQLQQRRDALRNAPAGAPRPSDEPPTRGGGQPVSPRES